MTIPKTETQHNQIDGGALAFSSTPRLFTIYVSFIFSASGSKSGMLQRIYFMYFHEQWNQIRISRLNSGKRFEIKNMLDFIDVYGDSTDREHNLLCELY